MEGTEEKAPRRRAPRKKAVADDAPEQTVIATTETTEEAPAVEASAHEEDETEAHILRAEDHEDGATAESEEEALDEGDDFEEINAFDEVEDEDLAEIHEDAYPEEETDDEIEGTLTHVGADGRAQMVDISSKPVTSRTAVATGYVRMSRKTLAMLENQSLPKGDALTVAEVAGIMAAKRTSELIPLCHPIALTNVTVHCEVTPSGVLVRAEASTQAQTGVEMEALTGVTVASLTIYDMCKGVEPGIVIADVQLNTKTGGVHGDWQAPARPAAAPTESLDESSEYETDDLDIEEEEQIVPRSVPQPEVPRDRNTYRRDSWGNRPAKPYDRDADRSGGYPANRPASGGYSGGYNRDRGQTPGGGYGSRPANPRPTPGAGYQGNRDRNPSGGGYNRDRPQPGYGQNKPGYPAQGNNYNSRDRGSSYGNRPDNRSGGFGGNRDRTPGNTSPGGYRPGGYGGNRDRPASGGYGQGQNKPGFAGFRDRNRDRERDAE